MEDQAPKDTPPASASDVLSWLEGAQDSLPKRLQQCATFTRQHLHLIAVSTVSEMAEAAEVAPSVYMRFCQAMGFSGYSEMQDLFREHVTQFRPDYRTRLEKLSHSGPISTPQLLADFAESGHKSLISLSNTVTMDGLNRIADGMATARVVHLIGLRRAYAVVSAMAYLFSEMGVPAQLHHGSGLLNSASTFLSDDAVFAVTFAPFSDETITLAKDAADKGARVFGLSDAMECPLSEFAQDLLIARENEVAGFRTLNGAMTLATTLAVATKIARDRG